MGTRLTPGESGALGLGGDVGIGYGFGIARLSGAHRREEEQAAIVLASSGVGLAAGYWLGHARDYSYGDVAVMRTAGYVGALSGLAVSVQDKNSKDETRAGAMMAGSAVGLVLGDRVVEGAGFSFGQSIGVDFMTVAGSLLGWSVALLLGQGASNDEAMFAAASAAGAIAGFAAGVATQPRGGRPERTSLRLDVEPKWLAHAGGGGEIVPRLVMRAALP